MPGGEKPSTLSPFIYGFLHEGNENQSFFLGQNSKSRKGKQEKEVLNEYLDIMPRAEFHEFVLGSEREFDRWG